MRARLFVIAAGACALLATSANAQVVDTVTEPRDAAKLALVRELMATANYRSQLVRTMRETSTRQGATMPVPPRFWDKLIARAEQDVDSLLAPMIEDYTRYFTSAELKALIAFSKSPVGQRLHLVNPIISANSAYVGQQWGQRVGMELSVELMNDGAPKDPAKPVKPAKKP